MYRGWEWMKSWIIDLYESKFFQMDSYGKCQNIEAKNRPLFSIIIQWKIDVLLSLKIGTSRKMSITVIIFIFWTILTLFYQENEAILG